MECGEEKTTPNEQKAVIEEGEAPGVYTVTPLNIANNGSESLRDRWLSAINKRQLIDVGSTSLNLHLTQQQFDALNRMATGSKENKRRSLPSGVGSTSLRVPLSAVNTTSVVTASTSTVTNSSGAVVDVGVCSLTTKTTLTSSSYLTANTADSVIPPDGTMGPLRSGRVYSPSRGPRGVQTRATPRSAARKTNPYQVPVQRDRSTCASGNAPVIEPSGAPLVGKRRSSCSPPDSVLPAHKKQPMNIVQGDMEIGAEVEISGAREVTNCSSGDMISMIQNLMKDSLDKMSKKNDELIKVVSDKNEECVKSIGELRNMVGVQGSAIEVVKTDMAAASAEVKTLTKTVDQVKTNLNKQLFDLSAKTNALEGKTENQKMEFSNAAKKHIDSLERRIRDLERSGEKDADGNVSQVPFPNEKTLMITRVYLKEGLDVDEIVKLILHGALKLTTLRIIRVEDMGVYFGRHSLKVELETAQAVKDVMDHKSLLSTSTLKDLRSVFIKRSRPAYQRVQDHNYKVMMRELNIGDKYRTDRSGRFVLRDDTGSADRSSVSGDSGEMQVDAGQDIPEGGGDRGTGERLRGRGRNHGRGRGHWRGRGRGRGHGRGRGRVFEGPKRPPLQVDPAVTAAFTRAPGAGADGEAADERDEFGRNSVSGQDGTQ